MMSAINAIAIVETIVRLRKKKAYSSGLTGWFFTTASICIIKKDVAAIGMAADSSALSK